MSLEEQIRELAYLKWEQAGYPQGDGVCFWVEAETAILSDTPCASFKKVPCQGVAAKISPLRHKHRDRFGRFAPK